MRIPVLTDYAPLWVIGPVAALILAGVIALHWYAGILWTLFLPIIGVFAGLFLVTVLRIPRGGKGPK